MKPFMMGSVAPQLGGISNQQHCNPSAQMMFFPSRYDYAAYPGVDEVCALRTNALPAARAISQSVRTRQACSIRL